MVLRKRTVAALGLAVLLCFSSVVYAEGVASIGRAVTTYAAEFGKILEEGKKRDSALFVGDIMLARNVERTLSQRGEDHALAGIGDLFRAKWVVGNFEASVPAVHQPTPDFVMKFSVHPDNLAILSDGGVTHLSLANNHALDHGADGYQNTIRELQEGGMETFGHPTTISTSSIKYVKIGRESAAIIAISSVFGYPPESEWLPVIAAAEAKSDLQIVYIHWGVEYELVHNPGQERFAEALIDAGIDLIIGHHPHVVQDVQRYQNGVVFYSLGNFIFDQYWNDDVQTGLAVELKRERGEWQIELRPVESKTARVQPREMEDKEREAFLAALAARSDPSLAAEITAGMISLRF